MTQAHTDLRWISAATGYGQNSNVCPQRVPHGTLSTRFFTEFGNWNYTEGDKMEGL